MLRRVGDLSSSCGLFCGEDGPIWSLVMDAEDPAVGEGSFQLTYWKPAEFGEGEAAMLLQCLNPLPEMWGGQRGVPFPHTMWSFVHHQEGVCFSLLHQSPKSCDGFQAHCLSNHASLLELVARVRTAGTLQLQLHTAADSEDLPSPSDRGSAGGNLPNSPAGLSRLAMENFLTQLQLCWPYLWPRSPSDGGRACALTLPPPFDAVTATVFQADVRVAVSLMNGMMLPAVFAFVELMHGGDAALTAEDGVLGNADAHVQVLSFFTGNDGDGPPPTEPCGPAKCFSPLSESSPSSLTSRTGTFLDWGGGCGRNMGLVQTPVRDDTCFDGVFTMPVRVLAVAVGELAMLRAANRRELIRRLSGHPSAERVLFAVDFGAPAVAQRWADKVCSAVGTARWFDPELWQDAAEVVCSDVDEGPDPLAGTDMLRLMHRANAMSPPCTISRPGEFSPFVATPTSVPFTPHSLLPEPRGVSGLEVVFEGACVGVGLEVVSTWFPRAGHLSASSCPPLSQHSLPTASRDSVRALADVASVASQRAKQMVADADMLADTAESLEHCAAMFDGWFSDTAGRGELQLQLELARRLLLRAYAFSDFPSHDPALVFSNLFPRPLSTTAMFTDSSDDDMAEFGPGFAADSFPLSLSEADSVFQGGIEGSSRSSNPSSPGPSVGLDHANEHRRNSALGTVTPPPMFRRGNTPLPCPRIPSRACSGTTSASDVSVDQDVPPPPLMVLPHHTSGLERAGMSWWVQGKEGVGPCVLDPPLLCPTLVYAAWTPATAFLYTGFTRSRVMWRSCGTFGTDAPFSVANIARPCMARLPARLNVPTRQLPIEASAVCAMPPCEVVRALDVASFACRRLLEVVNSSVFRFRTADFQCRIAGSSIVVETTRKRSEAVGTARPLHGIVLAVLESFPQQVHGLQYPNRKSMDLIMGRVFPSAHVGASGPCVDPQSLLFVRVLRNATDFTQWCEVVNVVVHQTMWSGGRHGVQFPEVFPPVRFVRRSARVSRKRTRTTGEPAGTHNTPPPPSDNATTGHSFAPFLTDGTIGVHDPCRALEALANHLETVGSHPAEPTHVGCVTVSTMAGTTPTLHARFTCSLHQSWTGYAARVWQPTEFQPFLGQGQWSNRTFLDAWKHVVGGEPSLVAVTHGTLTTLALPQQPNSHLCAAARYIRLLVARVPASCLPSLEFTFPNFRVSVVGPELPRTPPIPTSYAYAAGEILPADQSYPSTNELPPWVVPTKNNPIHKILKSNPFSMHTMVGSCVQ